MKFFGRTRSESGENKTDWDPPGEAGQVLPYPDPHTDGSHLENYMSYQTPDLDLKISGETDLGDSILKTAQDEVAVLNFLKCFVL